MEKLNTMMLNVLGESIRKYRYPLTKTKSYNGTSELTKLVTELSRFMSKWNPEDPHALSHCVVHGEIKVDNNGYMRTVEKMDTGVLLLETDVIIGNLATWELNDRFSFIKQCYDYLRDMFCYLVKAELYAALTYDLVINDTGAVKKVPKELRTTFLMNSPEKILLYRDNLTVYNRAKNKIKDIVRKTTALNKSNFKKHNENKKYVP